MSSDPIADLDFTRYRNAAGLGAHYELALRMLASKVPALRQLAIEKNLEAIEQGVREHFASDLNGRR